MPTELRIKRLDPELHRAFKLVCVKDEITIQDAIVALMKQAVKRGRINGE